MSNEAPAAAPPTVTPPAPTQPPAAAPAAGQPPAAQPPAAAPEPEPKKSLLGDAKVEPKDGQPQKQGAPEKYSDFTLPEGINPDPKLMDSFRATAKDLGLSQDSAQKLVTLQSEHAMAELKTRLDWFQTQVDEWKAQTQKELGAEFAKELSFAARALDRFGSSELRQLLDETGFGNHPLMAKAWIAIGKAMAEDGMPGPSGSVPGDDEQSQLRRMFPSMYNEDGTPKK